ncbi:MAG TPA: hypothetical protein VMU25_03615 [Candidatus Paceibacterota bacterium]|nr:hypothetical protein [Candidatus Paceibacterota bacterium]
MTPIRTRLKRPFLREIPLSAIICDDSPSYREAGYGGTPIREWPFYRFYAMYLSGAKEEAARAYEKWYAEQFAQFKDVPKTRGGMQGGSLERTIIELHRNRAIPFTHSVYDPDLVKEGIAQRVHERFELLESIKQKGYTPSPRDLVKGIRRGNTIMLKHGHHRAAALLALGYSEMPSVFVVPSFQIFLVRYTVKP